jgi:OMF family outer membrane factor
MRWNIRVVQPITLNQAIELALKNNQTLQTARVDLEIARAQLKEQQAAYYPRPKRKPVSLRINRQLPKDRMSWLVKQAFPATRPEDSTNLQGSVSIVYGVYTGGERTAQIKRAEKVIRQRELEVERVSEQTRFDATDAYYELQRGDAQVANRPSRDRRC